MAGFDLLQQPCTVSVERVELVGRLGAVGHRSGRPRRASDQRPAPWFALTVGATDSIMEARAEVAQVVEHGTENAGVDSSSLSLGTSFCFSALGGEIASFKRAQPRTTLRYSRNQAFHFGNCIWG